MSDKVYLGGYMDVPAERLEAVRAALPEHVALTLAEEGCLAFSVEESPSVKGRFVVAEVFVDEEAFSKHQERSRASDWFEITKGIERHFEKRVGDSG